MPRGRGWRARPRRDLGVRDASARRAHASFRTSVRRSAARGREQDVGEARPSVSEVGATCDDPSSRDGREDSDARGEESARDGSPRSSREIPADLEGPRRGVSELRLRATGTIGRTRVLPASSRTNVWFAKEGTPKRWRRGWGLEIRRASVADRQPKKPTRFVQGIGCLPQEGSVQGRGVALGSRRTDGIVYPPGLQSRTHAARAVRVCLSFQACRNAHQQRYRGDCATFQQAYLLRCGICQGRGTGFVYFFLLEAARFLTRARYARQGHAWKRMSRKLRF